MTSEHPRFTADAYRTESGDLPEAATDLPHPPITYGSGFEPTGLPPAPDLDQTTVLPPPRDGATAPLPRRASPFDAVAEPADLSSDYPVPAAVSEQVGRSPFAEQVPAFASTPPAWSNQTEPTGSWNEHAEPTQVGPVWHTAADPAATTEAPSVPEPRRPAGALDQPSGSWAFGPPSSPKPADQTTFVPPVMAEPPVTPEPAALPFGERPAAGTPRTPFGERPGASEPAGTEPARVAGTVYGRPPAPTAVPADPTPTSASASASAIDQTPAVTDTVDKPEPEPEAAPTVRNGRVLLAVLGAAILLLVVPFTVVWLLAPDDKLATGQCIKQEGRQAVPASCTDEGAFRIDRKVADEGDCPDPTQPFAKLERGGVLCLKPPKA